MAINIFSGGRRIAVVLGGVVAAVATSVAWMIATENKPQVSFWVSEFGREPVAVERCSYESQQGTHYATLTTRDSIDVNVTMCFSPMQATTGDVLIGYADAGNGMVRLGGPYDQKVTDYMQSIYRSFIIDHQDDQVIQIAVNAWRRTFWMAVIGTFASSVAFVWLVTKLLGWIVRGFLGVPTGQDMVQKHEKA